MAIDVVFKLLKIVGDREARNRNGVPQARSTRKYIRIERTVASS